MTTSTLTDAQPPFDWSAQSDLILRSSDNVDFHVLKILLRLSSPYFENMLSHLPVPAAASSAVSREEKKIFLPVISLTEESKTLQNFLPFFYPGNPPRLQNLDDVLNVMAAGHKYKVDIVKKRMSQTLLALPMMTEDPLRMFAFAFHRGLEEIGRVAAKNTLAISVSDLKFSPELAYISGTETLQLLQYRLECISAIRDSLLDGRFFTGSNNYDLHLPKLEIEDHHIRPRDHQARYGFSSEDCLSKLLPEDLMIDTSCIRDFHRNSVGLKWWVTYIRELFREIEARPRGSTVLNSRLSDVAVQRAIKCSYCNTYVHQDIANFKQQFAANIEEVVSKVVLKVDFSGSQKSQTVESPGGDV